MRIRIQPIALLVMIGCSERAPHPIGPDPAGQVAAPLSGGGGASDASSPAPTSSIPSVPPAPTGQPGCPNGGGSFGQAAGCFRADPCQWIYGQCGTFTTNNDFSPLPGNGGVGTVTITCPGCPSGLQCGGNTVVQYSVSAYPAGSPYPQPNQPYCQAGLPPPNSGPSCPSNHWCMPACTAAESGQTVSTGLLGVGLICP